MTQRQRDDITAVGAALRRLVGQAAATNLSPRQYRVLLAVLHYTASWSRLEDTVAVGQLADLTGIDRRHVRRALTDLAALDLIMYRHGDSPRGRARTASVIGLPGAEASPRLPGAESGPRSGSRPGAGTGHDRGPVRDTTGGRYGTRPGAGAGPPPEETPEETPEGASRRAPLEAARAQRPATTSETLARERAADAEANRRRAALDAHIDDLPADQRAELAREAWEQLPEPVRGPQPDLDRPAVRGLARDLLARRQGVGL